MAKQVTQFEIGDVVVLKSDGPLMTVSEIMSSHVVVTYWYDGSYEERVFLPEILKES